jgi:hypothetical protein
MSSAGNNASYKAPLFGCDIPKESLIKDDYQVFLHKGYSLDEHKRLVGNAVDFNSAIQRVDNETKYHGVLYTATLNQDALAAVRAEFGVDFVVCEGLLYHA